MQSKKPKELHTIQRLIQFYFTPFSNVSFFLNVNKTIVFDWVEVETENIVFDWVEASSETIIFALTLKKKGKGNSFSIRHRSCRVTYKSDINYNVGYISLMNYRCTYIKYRKHIAHIHSFMYRSCTLVS